MVILASLIFSLCVMVIVFLLMKRAQAKSTVAQRILDMPLTPEEILLSKSKPNQKLTKSEELTLEEVLKAPNNVVKDLYLAGIRQKKSLTIFQALLKSALLIPVALLVFYAVIDKLNMDNAINAGLIGILLFAITRTMISSAKRKRQAKMLRELPQFLDLLVVCVEAGLGFTAAIERMLKEVDPKEPLAAEFNLMYHEYLSGLSLSQSCMRLDQRCQLPELTFILNAIVQSDAMGASLGQTLRIQSIELRDKMRQKMRERALKIPVKILFPIMPLFFSIFVFALGPALYQAAKIFFAK